MDTVGNVPSLLSTFVYVCVALLSLLKAVSVLGIVPGHVLHDIAVVVHR